MARRRPPSGSGSAAPARLVVVIRAGAAAAGHEHGKGGGDRRNASSRRWRRPRNHTVQVLSWNAFSRHAVRAESSTSSGLNGGDALDEVVLAEAVQRPHGEPAGVDLGPLLQEGLELVVDGEMAGEGLLADRRIAAGARRQQHPGAVQHDRHVEALAHEAGRGQEVDQRNGSLVGHRVDEDERLLALLGLDVGEHLLLDVEEDLAVGGQRVVDGLRHVHSSSVRSAISWVGQMAG